MDTFEVTVSKSFYRKNQFVARVYRDGALDDAVPFLSIAEMRLMRDKLSVAIWEASGEKPAEKGEGEDERPTQR